MTAGRPRTDIRSFFCHSILTNCISYVIIDKLFALHYIL